MIKFVTSVFLTVVVSCAIIIVLENHFGIPTIEGWVLKTEKESEVESLAARVRELEKVVKEQALALEIAKRSVIINLNQKEENDCAGRAECP